MRMAVGLLGLLFVIGIVVMLMSKQLDRDKGTLAVKKDVEPQLQQMAGRDSEGNDVRKSYDLAPDDNSKMTGVIVTKLDEGSALQTFYGLKKNDVILEMGPLAVNTMATASEAKDMLMDAYQKQQPLVVTRSEQRLTLPLPPSQQTAATPPANAQPNSPPAPPPDNRSPLQRQLDAIQKVPTH